MEPYSSDESKLEFTIRIQRLPKGQFAFGGVLDVKYDMDETTIVCIEYCFNRLPPCYLGLPLSFSS